MRASGEMPRLVDTYARKISGLDGERSTAGGGIRMSAEPEANLRRGGGTKGPGAGLGRYSSCLLAEPGTG